MNKLFVRCICTSAQRLQVKTYQEQGYEIINLSKQRDRRSEANSYKMKLPFIVKNGKAEQI